MNDEVGHRDEQTHHFPIVEEILSVERRTVETGRVRVTSVVTSREAAVREKLARSSIRIERFPVDRLVDVAPLPRVEGLRTILCVTEEVLVKRFRVIEEIHLVSETRSNLHEQMVTLRRLDVAIERSPSPEANASAVPTTANPES